MFNKNFENRCFKPRSFWLIGFTVTLLSACGGNSGNRSEPSELQFRTAPGLSDPSLAYGLSEINDWHVGLPFLDIMKMSRKWLGHKPNQWGGMDYEELSATGVLDEHGWPTAIPAELEKIGTVFAWDGNEYGQGENRKGEYTLTYDGAGDLRVWGLLPDQIVSEAPGRVVLNINNDQGNWGFHIHATSPGNHIRNVKIIKTVNQELYDAGAIFNPDWLAIIKDARQIRFMDMMGTNNSTISTWSEQRSYDDVTWAGNVPVEVQVRLANEIGADPWFNMPFHADDNYIRQFSEYVYDNLDAGLIAHVELSNEVWNWAFQQAQDSHQMAISLWNLDPNDAGAGWVNFYGKRASEVMQIWTDVFADESDSRLKRIAGTQAFNSYISELVLTAPMWQRHDPNNYVAPHTYFDALAPATYFGGSVISSEDYRNAMLAAIDDQGVDNYEFHYRLLKGEIGGYANHFQEAIDDLRKQRVITDSYGLELIAYEGGQHIHHSAFTNISDEDLQRLQDHLTGFVRSQQMADFYQELWDEWKQIGTGPFMHFVEIGEPSRWGSWGPAGFFD